MLIAKFVLIDNGVIQVVRKFDRAVVLHTFQSDNDFVLDLVPSESASLAQGSDYDFWYAALGYAFKPKVNRNL
jgi:hypothetical protein